MHPAPERASFLSKSSADFASPRTNAGRGDADGHQFFGRPACRPLAHLTARDMRRPTRPGAKRRRVTTAPSCWPGPALAAHRRATAAKALTQPSSRSGRQLLDEQLHHSLFRGALSSARALFAICHATLVAHAWLHRDKPRRPMLSQIALRLDRHSRGCGWAADM